MVAQVGRVLVTLYRLSTHPSPDWDCLEVWRTVDIVDVIGKITANMQAIPKQGEENAPAAAGDPGQELQCAKFCTSIQAILDGSEDVGQQPQQQQESFAGVGEMAGSGPGAGLSPGGSAQQQYYQAPGSSLGNGCEANMSFMTSSEADMPFSWTPEWPGRGV
jgi:hypothetical protein